MIMHKKNTLLVLIASVAMVSAVASWWYFTQRCARAQKTSVVISHSSKNNAHQQALCIETLYGTFDVADPVLIDLIDSKAMQRLKNIYQYGIAYFLDNRKLYTRFEHCVGVWALLRLYGLSMEEQIAGLLHDASHTVFSHLGDHIFNHDSTHGSYQDSIHEWYLNKTTIPTILKKHGYSLEAVLHKDNGFKALEQDLPDLCADRIEYNIKGGLIENLIVAADVPAILQALHYEDGRWYFTDVALAAKFSYIPLHLTVHEWGSPISYLSQSWAGVAMRRAMTIGLVSYQEVHFSTDDVIWQRLVTSDDPEIMQQMRKIKAARSLFVVTEPETADIVVKTKFRGVNPWVKTRDGFARLADLDRDFSLEYNRVKQQIARGWPVQLLQSEQYRNTVRDIGKALI